MQTSNDIEICPEWLLRFIRCPISHSPLSVASPALLAELAVRHSESPLSNRAGRTISDVPTQGLLSGDGCWLYPIRNQIPSLIPDEAISIR